MMDAEGVGCRTDAGVMYVSIIQVQRWGGRGQKPRRPCGRLD